MTVDLDLEELVYLIQSVNQDFRNKHRATGNPTPFEAEVFRKLGVARQTMMQERPKENNR